MQYIYLFVVDGAEWEDIVVFLSKEEAIAKSKQCPHVRLEIFEKTPTGYRPIYNYYLNGLLKEPLKE